MEKYLLSKILVIGVIILFAGASVVSGINSNVELVDVINEIGNLNRGTETFYPTDDVYIDMRSPNGNQGDDVDLKISNRYGATPDWERDLLFKFDISSISSGALIESATLKIFYYQYLDTNPAGRELTLYRITSNWNEDSVTWNTRPNLAAETTASSVVPSSPGAWMEWEVTTDVKDFVDGEEANYGWQILDETYWGGPNLPTSKFHSKEYSANGNDYIPYLEIDVLEPHMAFLFGRIENLNAEGDLTTFDAVRLRYLQFSPFSFNTYISGEEIAVVGSGLGIVTTSFAFGLFSAAVL